VKQLLPTTSSRWAIAVALLFLFALLLLSTAISSVAVVVFTAGAFVLFALPGILLGPLFFGKEAHCWPERLIWGVVLGIAASSYVAIAVGFLHSWSTPAIVLAIMGLSILCAILGRAFRSRVLLPPARKWTAPDYAALAAMGLVLVLFSAIPFLSVGKLTPHGYAYKWLFGIDFLLRSDFISAMTVKLPPDFFCVTGTPLRMYLVGYALPAFVYAASGKTIPLHSILLVSTLGFSLLMLGCLYVFLRTVFQNTKAVLSTAFLAMLAYSYYWLYDLAKAIVVKPGQVKGLWSDPKLWDYGSVSHLFQRLFLVEPQAVLATCLLLVVLSALKLCDYRLKNVDVATLIGVCLGISFGTDAMQGLVVILWFGLTYLVRWSLARENFREEFIPFLVAVVSTGLISASFFVFGMYKSSTSQQITLQPNLWILVFGFLYFPIDFGPLLLLGVWGFVRWWRHRRSSFEWPLLLLAGVALVQVAFVNEVLVPRTRMVNRLWPIVLLVGAGSLFCDLWAGQIRSWRHYIAAAIVLAAIPTFFTDIYFTSDVGDVYDTRYVRTEDQLACDWIRHNLPQAAIIQGEPQYYVDADRGLYISLISSFAERPQILGWYSAAAKIAEGGRPVADQRRADVKDMLDSAGLPTLMETVRKYSIDYLYVGPFEQAQHRNFLALVQSAPDRFREVYSANGVHIFQCLERENAGNAPPAGQ
jgi:hypothetical protein